MAIGSGLGAQLGIAAESTYGTFVAPGRVLEFTKEGLAIDVDGRIRFGGNAACQNVVLEQTPRTGLKI